MLPNTLPRSFGYVNHVLVLGHFLYHEGSVVQWEAVVFRLFWFVAPQGYFESQSICQGVTKTLIYVEVAHSCQECSYSQVSVRLCSTTNRVFCEAGRGVRPSHVVNSRYIFCAELCFCCGWSFSLAHHDKHVQSVVLLPLDPIVEAVLLWRIGMSWGERERNVYSLHDSAWARVFSTFSMWETDTWMLYMAHRKCKTSK